jgi:hypothetical protein
MSELQALVKKAETEFYPWVIEHLTIETPEQAKNCSDMLAIGKALFKSLEEDRKAEKQPLIDQAKAVDDLYSPAKNRIQMAVGRLDDGLITYHRKAKAEADALLKLQYEEQETKRLAAEAALIETMIANRAALVFEPAPLPALPETEAIIVEPVKQSIRGNMGTTQIKEVPEFTLIPGEEGNVPRNLCSPDMAKIKKWYAAGFHEIPGVMVTMKSHTVSRFS